MDHSIFIRLLGRCIGILVIYFFLAYARGATAFFLFLTQTLLKSVNKQNYSDIMSDWAISFFVQQSTGPQVYSINAILGQIYILMKVKKNAPAQQSDKY